MPKKRYVKKKRTYRKGKVMRVGRMMSNQNRTYKMVFDVMYQVTNPATGTAGYSSVAINACLNFPCYGRVASGYGVFPSKSAVFTTMYPLFDLYRVKKLETRFEPNFVDVRTSVTDNSNDNPSIMYIYNDLDDEALVTSESEMFNQGIKSRNFAMGKTLKHIFVNKDKEWLNTGSITLTPSATTTAGTNLNPRIYASTKTYFPLLYHQATGGNTQYHGRLYFRWLVEFKSLKVS